VVVPGTIRGGDVVSILHRPEHDVTVALTYRAMMTAPELLASLLAAGDDLPADIHEMAIGASQAR
jgi:MOSC domain-containing protein YiiM